MEASIFDEGILCSKRGSIQGNSARYQSAHEDFRLQDVLVSYHQGSLSLSLSYAFRLFNYPVGVGVDGAHRQNDNDAT